MSPHSPRPRLRALAGAALLAALGCGDAPPHAAPPHVLLVVVDTLRADRVGSYGADRDTTPSLDALARDAVRFESAYATAPWTQPSIASLLTGLYPASHGLERPGRLPAKPATLAGLLAARGYATSAVVSHLLISHRMGFHRGFQHFDAAESRRNAPRKTSRGITGRAVRELERLAAGERPFFLLVHYFDPHYEYLRHPSIGFAAPRAGRLDGSQRIEELRALAPTLSSEELGFLRDVYDEEVRHTDASLGQLFAALRRLGLWDETLLVVTADHGEEFLERGWIGHTRTLYDELVRVPLLVRPPGGGGGRVVAEPVSLASLPTTVLAFAGAVAADGVRRLPSLHEAVLGLAPPPAEPVLFEVDFVPIQASLAAKTTHKVGLRVGDLKVIRDERSGAVEVYDLASDPAERRNLWQHAPDRAEPALARLEAFERALAPADPGASQPATFDAAELERLRAIGYVDAEAE